MSSVFEPLEKKLLLNRVKDRVPEHLFHTRNGNLYGLHIIAIEAHVEVIAEDMHGMPVGQYTVTDAQYTSEGLVIAAWMGIEENHRGKGLARPLITAFHDGLQHLRCTHKVGLPYNAIKLGSIYELLGYRKVHPELYTKKFG